ncbi:MAG: hypothetical protein ABIX28_00610 [Vicinamibacterales bacterium]
MSAFRLRRVVTLQLALALAGIVSAAAQTASNSPRERFTAVAVNNSTVGRAGATPIDITISQWTSDADRDKLMTVFKEKGEKALLSALQDQKPIGTISTPGSIAYDLRYAREMKTAEGDRRIILATDRPIGFWEASNQPRTVDYPFTLIEMRLGKSGTGEGKLSVATKLTLENNTLVIENYANQPVMLNDIKQKK